MIQHEMAWNDMKRNGMNYICIYLRIHDLMCYEMICNILSSCPIFIFVDVHSYAGEGSTFVEGGSLEGSTPGAVPPPAEVWCWRRIPVFQRIVEGMEVSGNQ